MWLVFFRILRGYILLVLVGSDDFCIYCKWYRYENSVEILWEDINLKWGTE